mmetsp:Transcript_7607/g.18630  ORF Transcript_7607/g.18630 Transcript_7607/m.18630 type:complete len:237 (+) Transcript_7607:1524-2234(+)
MRCLFGNHSHVFSRTTSHLCQVSSLTNLLLFLHFSMETIDVDGHTQFFCHKLRQINWESHGRVEIMGILATKDSLVAVLFFGSGSEVLEFLQSLIESAGEGFLFVSDDRNNVVLFFLDFRESDSHDFDEFWYKLTEEAEFGSKILSSVPNSTSEDSSQDVTSSIVRRNSSIGNGETQRSDVIGNDTVGHVDKSLVFLGTNFSSVGTWGPRQNTNFFEKRLEDIRVVIRIDTLQDRG